MSIENLNGKKITLLYHGSNYNCTFRIDEYSWTTDKRVSLILENGEPFTILTKCVSVELESNEIAVKMYSENEPMRDQLLQSGYFEDTNIRIPAGYTELEVWRVK